MCRQQESYKQSTQGRSTPSVSAVWQRCQWLEPNIFRQEGEDEVREVIRDGRQWWWQWRRAFCATGRALALTMGEKEKYMKVLGWGVIWSDLYLKTIIQYKETIKRHYKRLHINALPPELPLLSDWDTEEVLHWKERETCVSKRGLWANCIRNSKGAYFTCRSSGSALTFEYLGLEMWDSKFYERPRWYLWET